MIAHPFQKKVAQLKWPLILALFIHLLFLTLATYRTTFQHENQNASFLTNTIHVNLGNSNLSQAETGSTVFSPKLQMEHQAKQNQAQKEKISKDYLSRWQAHVEAVGNQHYPTAADQKKLTGQLQLQVTIKPNGSIQSIEIKRSSGHSILDAAAIQIVKLAAPFEPFPESLQDLEGLEIIRTWQFSGQFATPT